MPAEHGEARYGAHDKGKNILVEGKKEASGVKVHGKSARSCLMDFKEGVGDGGLG